ncbi:MAG: hypothetical protein M3P22_02255 [bacterium]|nr:hypothetical protein [bacterium]
MLILGLLIGFFIGNLFSEISKSEKDIPHVSRDAGKGKDYLQKITEILRLNR